MQTASCADCPPEKSLCPAKSRKKPRSLILPPAPHSSPSQNPADKYPDISLVDFPRTARCHPRANETIRDALSRKDDPASTETRYPEPAQRRAALPSLSMPASPPTCRGLDE